MIFFKIRDKFHIKNAITANSSVCFNIVACLYISIIGHVETFYYDKCRIIC
jgi:hypothetical protein